MSAVNNIADRLQTVALFDRDTLRNFRGGVTEAPTDVFGQFYQAAMGTIQVTNEHQKAAEQLQIDFAAGRTDDILAVVLAQERAHASLSFTVQTTTRILESYREIMRMQI